MQTKNRIAALVASITFLMSCVTVNAQSEITIQPVEENVSTIHTTTVEDNVKTTKTADGIITETPFFRAEGIFQASTNKKALVGQQNLAGAKEALHQGALNFQQEIDISSYHIPCENVQFIFDMINNNEDLFYVAQKIGYEITSAKEIGNVIFHYAFTPEQVKVMNAEIDAQVTLACEPIISTMTDAEKALIIHDFLASTGDYNLNAVTGSITDPYMVKNHSMYGILVEKEGVCESYAEAFDYILKKLGIQAQAVISNTMGHEWSAAQIDGEWYHVDVTWDDPIFAETGGDQAKRIGLVTHDNFLLSDTGIKKNPHTAWSLNEPCTQTKYDDFFWRNVNGRFAFVAGIPYFEQNGSMATADLITGKTSSLQADFGSNIRCVDQSKGNLYFSDTAGQLYIRTQNGRIQKSKLFTNMYGFAILGNVLKYQDYNSVINTTDLPLPTAPPEQMPADLNGDGKVDITDLMSVLHHVSKRTTFTQEQITIADVTHDGKVDINDLMKILHFVSKRIPSLD